MAKEKTQQETFDWYAIPMVQRVKIAEQLGKDVSNIMNQALKKARKHLKPYGMNLDADIKLSTVEKPELNQMAEQKS